MNRLTGSVSGTKRAEGSPPHVRGPWESEIIDLAERGDDRFIEILRGHVERGVIKGARAELALQSTNVESTS
jgi:hypothetical protein